MVRYDYDRDDYTDRRREDQRRERRLEDMIQDSLREIDRDTRPEDRVDRVMDIINDPSITLSPAQKKAVNDPKMMMTPDRRLIKVKNRQQFDQIAGRSPLYPPLVPTKRTRRKTKMDRTMSKCLKMANARLRLKNGRLRKGKTMSDVMKMAHRLCKKS